MMHDKYGLVLLMTATILPQESWNLKLKDPGRRLEQYISSLEYYIVNTGIERIVFCENSNYSFDTRRILQLAGQYGKEVEIIQFAADKDAILKHGKGYGEGEIIKYAMGKSRLLKQSEYFIKVTGRLKITNIDKIRAKLSLDRIYMNKSLIEYQAMDTVLYCMPKRVFQRHFMYAYRQVCDKKYNYIEHVFKRVVREDNLEVHSLPLYLDIQGVSGTVGVPYQKDMGGRRIYDLLSQMDLFNKNIVYRIIFNWNQRRRIK